MILAIIYSTALDMIRVNADKWPAEQEVEEISVHINLARKYKDCELPIYKSFVLQSMKNYWIHFIFCL